MEINIKKRSYEVGEKLLCYHGPLLYEAKLLKIDDSNENDILYYIHYNGWNKNYDEWVNSKRILKVNEKNLKLKDDLVKSAQSNKNVNNTSNSLSTNNNSKINFKPKITHSTNNNQHQNNSSNNDTLKKKRNANNDSSNDSESSDKNTNDSTKKHILIHPNQKFDQFLTNPDIKINISNELKEILLDDWDFVIHQNKLVKLPSEKNVVQILDDYISFKIVNNENLNDLNDTINDLKEYFNVMLGSQLLYKFERIQYIQIITDYRNKAMSEIYGLVHLLRLFGKFGNIISFAPVDETSLKQLIFYIHDILNFIETKYSDYYNESIYILATPEYVRRAFI